MKVLSYHSITCQHLMHDLKQSYHVAWPNNDIMQTVAKDGVFASFKIELKGLKWF